MRNRFVALSDLPQEEVYWHTALPPSLDLDRLEINVGRLATLRRLGGLASIDVIGYEGEMTRYALGSSESNADGTSSASGTIAVEKVDPFEVELDFKRDPRIFRFQRSDARIKINTSEVYERVRSADQLGQYELDWHTLYARELHYALANGVSQAAYEHLILNCDSRSRLDFWFSTAVGGLLAASHGGGLDNMAYYSLLMHTFLGNFVNLGVGWMERKRYLPFFSDDDKLRLSLIDGYQFDRVAAVAGLARASRLVRARA